jgi:hypothetical protein
MSRQDEGKDHVQLERKGEGNVFHVILGQLFCLLPEDTTSSKLFLHFARVHFGATGVDFPRHRAGAL